MPENKARKEALTSLRAELRDIVDNIRTVYQQLDKYVYIPEVASKV